MSKGYAAGGAAKKMKKGYAAGGMASDSVGRALKRKTDDAEGRAMKKPAKMQMGGMADPRMMDPRMAGGRAAVMPPAMKKGGMAKKRGK